MALLGRRVEAASLRVLELGVQAVDQVARRRGPGLVLRGLREVEQALGQVHVVVGEARDLRTGPPGEAQQRPVLPAAARQQEARQVPRALEVGGLLQVAARAHEGGEQQAVQAVMTLSSSPGWRGPRAPS